MPISRPDPEAAIQFDRDKFLAAVHWIVARFSATPDRLGRTKLHKILYYSDMLCFFETGTPLTGVEYQKQSHGPTARYLGWALKELEHSGKISAAFEEYFGHQKWNFISLTTPASNLLSEHEVRLLEEVSGFVEGHSAKEISNISHAAPWQLVKMGERIPYGTAAWLWPSELRIHPKDLEWANQTADLYAAMGVTLRAPN